MLTNTQTCIIKKYPKHELSFRCRTNNLEFSVSEVSFILHIQLLPSFDFLYVCLYINVCVNHFGYRRLVVHPWLNKFLLSAKLLLQYPLCLSVSICQEIKNFFFSLFNISLSLKNFIKYEIVISGFSNQPQKCYPALTNG